MSEISLPSDLEALLEAALGDSRDCENPQPARTMGLFHEPNAAERVRERLRFLLDDGQTLNPPVDLKQRTLALVHQAQRRPLFAPPEWTNHRNPFRFADLAVAAAVFLASLLTLLPSLGHSRSVMGQLSCAFNLQQLGQSLHQFAVTKGHYPSPPEDCPNPSVAAFVGELRDSGMLTSSSLLDCPSNGVRNLGSIPPAVSFCADRGSIPAANFISQMDYSPNFGMADNGRIRRMLPRIDGYYPLLADRPALNPDGTIRPGNSWNHAQRGQNVYQASGAVRFLRNRSFGKDQDIYHNASGRVGPGLHEQDVCFPPPHASWLPR
jgi:hypothetical protein